MTTEIESLQQRLAAAEDAIESTAKQNEMFFKQAVDAEDKLAVAEALLETACDAWEHGMTVTGPDGVVLADYRAACLPRAWYERTKEVCGED